MSDSIGVIVNGIIIGIFSVAILVHIVCTAIARHHLHKQLPAFFWAYFVVLVVSDVVFGVATLLWLSLKDNDIAGDLVLAMPRWYSLSLVCLVGSNPPAGLPLAVDISLAVALSVIVPVTGIVASVITDVREFVDDAILVASCLLLLFLVYLICDRGRASSFLFPMSVFVACITAVSIARAFTSEVVDVAWIFLPVVASLFYISETYSVRRHFASTTGYIDFSTIRRFGSRGLIGYRHVELVSSHPLTIAFESASLQNTEYSNSKLIACYGFTANPPRFEIVMEAGLWSLSHLRAILARRAATRPDMISLVYLADCARAVQAVHTIDSSLSQKPMNIGIDDFVVCADGVKLKRVRNATSSTPTIYMAPESLVARASTRAPGEVEYQAMDIYALGVIFWEIMHPSETFTITWRQDQAQVFMGDFREELKNLMFKMLSRRTFSRPGIHDVVLEVDQLIYTTFAELTTDLDIDTPITGKALLQELLREHVAINMTEARRVCQYMLTSMILKVVHDVAADTESPASINFNVEDLEFSPNNIYMLFEPSMADSREFSTISFQLSDATISPRTETPFKSIEL